MTYGSFADPYCYKGSGVLINLADIRDGDALEHYEARMTSLRSSEPLPTGQFDPAHYRAIHHHLFQDVYDWAGEYRSIRIAKGQSMFCFPDHIVGQMDALFPRLHGAFFLPGGERSDFVTAAADFLAELNAIHPFRKGNGRTQLTFLFLLALRAGHPLDMARIRPEAMLAAMVASFLGELAALEREISGLVV